MAQLIQRSPSYRPTSHSTLFLGCSFLLSRSINLVLLLMFPVPPLLVLGISLISSKSSWNDSLAIDCTNQGWTLMVQQAICYPLRLRSLRTASQTLSQLATFSSYFLLALVSSLVYLLSLDRAEQQFLNFKVSESQNAYRSQTCYSMNAINPACVSLATCLASCNQDQMIPSYLSLSSVIFFRLSAYSSSNILLLNPRLVSQTTLEMLIIAGPFLRLGGLVCHKMNQSTKAT